jgi:hypothetical protein
VPSGRRVVRMPTARTEMNPANMSSSVPEYSPFSGSNRRRPPPLKPPPSIDRPTPFGGLKPMPMSNGPALPGSNKTSARSPTPVNVKDTGPIPPEMPAPTSSRTLGLGSAGTPSLKSTSSIEAGPIDRCGCTTTSNEPLPPNRMPSRPHWSPRGRPISVLPLPIRNRRNPSPSPGSKTNLKPFRSEASTIDHAPFVKSALRSTDADESSSRDAVGSPRSTVGAPGVKSKPIPMPAGGGGVADANGYTTVERPGENTRPNCAALVPARSRSFTFEWSFSSSGSSGAKRGSRTMPGSAVPMAGSACIHTAPCTGFPARCHEKNGRARDNGGLAPKSASGRPM